MKQRLLFFSFAAITFINVSAQPLIKAQKTIGGSGSDYLTCIAPADDGGMLLGGSSASNIFGEKSENSRGNFDYWIVKLDISGNIQWDKTFGGSQYDYLTTLQKTADGGYILGGYSDSPISGEKSENSRGNFDYWIIKIDASGNIQWDKTLGGNQLDELTSLQLSSDGGYILGGGSASNISGEKTEINRCGCDSYYYLDYWIIKLDMYGNIQWDKTIGGSGWDKMYSLQQTIDGGYILGGSSSSNGGQQGEKTEHKIGKSDYWIVKLDSSRNVEWDNTIGGIRSDQLSSILQTSDKGYMLGGTSETWVGQFNYWIAKLDETGNTIWENMIGGESRDYLSLLQPTLDGGYILGGYSSSDISRKKSENSRGEYDYWIVKINELGKVQWDKTIGGSLIDQLTSILENNREEYVIGGYSYSNRSGDKTRNSRGDADYWIVTLDVKKPTRQFVSGTDESNTITINQSFSVYPNPPKDILHIQATGKAIYTLTTNSGVTVLTQTINGKGEMNVSRMQSGVYYLKNNSSGEVKTIIIQ